MSGQVKYVEVGDFAYIPIYKCASSTINMAIKEAFTRPRVIQRDVDWLYNRIVVGDSGMWAFTFMRQPLRRLESAWRMFCTVKTKPIGRAGEMGVKPGLRFDQFLEIILSTPPATTDRHFMPVNLLLRNGDGRMLPGVHIYPLERFDEVWPSVIVPRLAPFVTHKEELVDPLYRNMAIGDPPTFNYNGLQGDIIDYYQADINIYYVILAEWERNYDDVV